MVFFKPVPGPYSIADDLSQRLLRRWVPKWYSAFGGGGKGLFFERLGHSFKPVSTGRRRLLSQLRQLSMYAHAARQAEALLFRPDLEAHFTAIVEGYGCGWEGGWVFALDDSGQVADPTLDLYTHAFVIFAFGHYAMATGDDAARVKAVETAGFVARHFRNGVEHGFTEALDAQGAPIPALPRRHESHMHLLEGVLFAHDAWPHEPVFMVLADELVSLFFGHFYEAGQNRLSEYFTPALEPAADAVKGVVICEPGHYYEWIWLLKKYARAKGAPAMHDATCLKLLEWANEKGWDSTFGGIYDELTIEGRAVTESKRLWPFTEAIKANALLLDIVLDRDGAKDTMARMARLFRDKYMQERGFWTEWLNRDLTPAVDYMPATTPYHVYFGIMETRDILQKRGSSKSWRAGPRRLAYATARLLSAFMRGTWGRMVKALMAKVATKVAAKQVATK